MVIPDVADLVIEHRRYGDPDVVRLVDEVQQEYVRRYGGPDAAVVDAAEFAPPAGGFLVGTLGAQPVVMGGWRRLDDTAGTAEVKRMYVVAAARRRGIGRRILAALESDAAEAGVRALVLNTGDEQPEAIALYESSGYRPVPGFGPYANAPGARFYGKRLDERAR